MFVPSVGRRTGVSGPLVDPRYNLDLKDLVRNRAVVLYGSADTDLRRAMFQRIQASELHALVNQRLTGARENR